MREGKDAIRWTLDVEGVEFAIYDIEGGKFNLCLVSNAGWVLDTYSSAEAAASALPRYAEDPRVGHLLNGKIVPGKLQDWTPTPRYSKR